MVIIYDGNKRKREILDSLRPSVHSLLREGIRPTLAIINVGMNLASLSFIRQKILALKSMGFDYEYYDFKSTAEEDEIIRLITELNRATNVNGILVQLPLPPHLNPRRILNKIYFVKDVDGLSEKNLGKLMHGDELIPPCAPSAVLDAIENAGVKLEGKNVVIISNSILIGKPLAMMLTNRYATVTLCHVKTKDLIEHTKRADILITATGVPKLIKKEFIKEKAIVIDVGFTKVNDEIYGDVNFEDIKDKCSFITPTPGGIGPVTVAMVIKNLITCTMIQAGMKHYYD